MRYELYIIICEVTLSLSIASNPYPLAFQNGNRRFNSASQYTKTSRPDRTPFIIGNVANPKNKNPSIFRNEGPASVVFNPGMPPNMNKVQQTAHSGNERSTILFPNMPPSRNNNPIKPLSGIPMATGSSDPNCNIESGQIIYMNKCQTLLSEEPCLPGQPKHWLLVNENEVPYCAKRPCKLEELFYNGKCVSISDTSVCGIFEILYIDFAGKVYCDCFQHYVYDSSVNKCFAPHEQGSCPYGKYLQLDSKNDVICVDNPCVTDNLIKNPNNGECYEKLFKGSCKEESGYQIFFQDDKTAICVRLDNRNIFEVPALPSCPAGSKIDHLGNCQKVFRLDGAFSLRVPSQQVSRYSQCPQGTIKYPDGSCRAINALLGR